MVWSDGTVIWNSIQQVIDYQLGPQHSTYAIIDLYYIGGRHDFSWPVLHQGGTVHVKPSSNFDAEEVVRYVAEQRSPTCSGCRRCCTRSSPCRTSRATTSATWR